MTAIPGPNTVMNSLLWSIDGGNQKSWGNHPTTVDHAFSSWYCFETGTATYAIAYAGTSIWELTSQGDISRMIGPATGPTRGTFAVTTGCTYYGDGPINLVSDGFQYRLAPLSMAGTTFIHYLNRFNPMVVYFYAPYRTAVINFYDGVAGGVTGNPTSTSTVAQGSTTTFALNNLNYVFFTSNASVVATAGNVTLPGDQTILSPATNYVYNRYQGFISTSNFTTPNISNAYVSWSDTLPVMSITIADGSGSDS